MYVFTQHGIGSQSAPMVAVFENIPATEDIAMALAMKMDVIDHVSIEAVLDDNGVGEMLQVAESTMNDLKDKGDWPSVEKLSDDGLMYFSFQWVHG